VSPSRACLFVIPCFALAHAAGAEPAAPPTPNNDGPAKARRVDLRGDPLPEGAVARLGAVQAGDGDAVEALAFAPDGKTLLSAHRGHDLRLWDTATGHELLRFRGHDGAVLALAFSPDGKAVASAGEDGSATLWAPAAGRRTGKLEAAGQRPLLAAFSPEGRPLAWAEDAGHTIHLWDVGTGQELRRFEGHSGRVHSVAPAPDGKTLASAGADGTVRLWDAATGQELRRLGGHKRPVLLLRFSPNGWALCGLGEGYARYLWEPSTGGLINAWEESGSARPAAPGLHPRQPCPGLPHRGLRAGHPLR
jgi:WD40 repeat protein